MPPTPEKSLVESNTAFALDLYARLTQREGNLFLSPLSIGAALAMAYAGARGQTASQMARVLHFTLPQSELHPAFGGLVADLLTRAAKGGCQLQAANALWVQKGYPVIEEFLGTLRSSYGSAPREADFQGAPEAAGHAINRWVEEATRGRISEIVRARDLGPLTRLILANAVYFKGNWAAPFATDATRDAPFTLLTGERIPVPMMHREGDFHYAQGGGFQAIELPYAGSELSLAVILPRKKDGLPALERSLAAPSLAEWLSRLRREHDVTVELPRFTIAWHGVLRDALALLGMADAFRLPPADLSGMTGKLGLFIGEVIHKTRIDVTEEGTEAAAATALTAPEAAPPGADEPLVFRADHPFLFLLRDRRSGSILFLGRLMDPKHS